MIPLQQFSNFVGVTPLVAATTPSRHPVPVLTNDVRRVSLAEVAGC